MERQSSFGSQSSGGSAYSTASATRLGDDHDKDALDSGNEGGASGPLRALFGALYTLAKEKINDTASVAMLAIWVDFLMIFTLLLMPEYPWKVDYKSWIYTVFYYIQIHLPIANTGYTFYLVIFYVLVAVLFVSVAICAWVGWCFMSDSFPFLWPIKVARVVVSLFVSMFYIASLNVFLMACACDNKGGGWKHLVFKIDCLSLPHVATAAVSIASSVVFFAVALLLVLGDHELEPMSRSLLAAPHSMCELRALLAKTVISVADLLLKPLPKVQVVLYAIACGSLFYYHARMVPHLVPWINVLRGGLNAVLAWVSLMACVLSYTVEWGWDKDNHPVWGDKAYRTTMTTLMAAGVPVAFLAGGGVCWLRLVHAWRAALKFRAPPPGARPRAIHRFWSEFDVEVAARIGRVWDAEGQLDPAALAIAENVLKAGVAMDPNSVFLHVAYSNFLIEARKNNAAGWAQLEEARRLQPNLSYQFSIFSRHQEHKQRGGGGAGGGGGDGAEGGAVDLVSYVEFQKNYKALLAYHKASLVATRDFWRLLTREAVPLERLGASFRRMDDMETQASRTYRLVLERYPKNAKLLRSYGKFLEHVKNDPWGAARYYAEAEKQEELEESRAAEVTVGGGGGDALAVDDKSSGVVTINAAGVMQMVNKVASTMLGYKKGELEGKNVSMLMPQPFSGRHNGFLRNFVNGGRAKILDSPREVVALHRERYVFPVRLLVTRVSGTGPDSVFMGLMRPAEPDPAAIKAWLLASGVVLCVDRSFMDYAGWGADELVGRPFSALAADPAEIDELIRRFGDYTEAQLAAGALSLDTRLRHKYAGDVPVRISVGLGGTEDQRILVMDMKRLEETPPMAAFDARGRFVYANAPLCALLGHSASALRGRDIGVMLPQPYGALHLRWIREAAAAAAAASGGASGGGMARPARQAPASCRNGATSVVVSANGAPQYVRTTIMAHTGGAGAVNLAALSSGSGGGGGTTYAVRLDRSSHDELLNERRLSLVVAADGRVVWASPTTPAALFGRAPAALVGARVTELVDVFADYALAQQEAAAISTAKAAVAGKLAGEAGRADDNKNDDDADDGVSATAVTTALAALLNRSASHPGSSWRVGVGASNPVVATALAEERAQHEAAAGASGAGGSNAAVAAAAAAAAAAATSSSGGGGGGLSSDLQRRLLLRQATGRGRLRPAVMTVAAPGDEGVSEQTAEAAAALPDAAAVIELWRADLLLGVAEVVQGCTVVRAERSVGLLLGVPAPRLVHTQLGRWLALPQGAGLADLMTSGGGRGQQRKGGLKASSASRVGPQRTLRGAHSDRRPVGVLLQACLKDGSQDGGRLVLAIKAHRPAAGARGALAALVAAELSGGPELGGDAAAAAAAAGGQPPEQRLLGPPPGVPGLALDKVGPATGGGFDLLGGGGHSTQRTTARSGGGGGIATARGVDVGVLPTSRTAAGLPRISDDNGGAGGGEEDEEEEQDDEASNQGGGGGRRGKPTGGGGRRRPVDPEEAGEAAMGARGAAKARQWLDSGFSGVAAAGRSSGGDDDDDNDSGGGAAGGQELALLPGAVPADEQGDGGGDMAAAVAAGLGGGVPVVDAASDGGASSSMGGAGGAGVSDYSRGKRLRKLTRLLSSRAAMAVVLNFRLRLLLLTGAILLLHFGAFGALLGFMERQVGYLVDLAAAGDVVDALTRTATLAAALDAAGRGAGGFTAADVAGLAAEMNAESLRFSNLHQGLYLGFSSLRALDTPALYALWHDADSVAASAFLDEASPTTATPEPQSLFDLGNAIYTAAREVTYAATHPPGGAPANAALNATLPWQFVMVNAPGVLFAAYLKSLDLMVLRAQDSVALLQRAVLALLLVEGVAVLLLAAGLAARLLQAVSTHRQALFSVFLAVPHHLLRTLASRSVSIGDDDADEEGAEDRLIDEAADAQRKQRRKQEADDGEEAVAAASGGGGGSDAGALSLARKSPRRASFAVAGASGGGGAAADAAVFVTAGARTAGRGSFTAGIGGAGAASVNASFSGVAAAGAAGGGDAAADRARLFNGKRLVVSAGSAYRLAWPIALWGAVVIALYGASHRSFGAINDSVVAVKLMQRTQAQADRLTLYATQLALADSAAARAALQPTVLAEAARVAQVYVTALYGGATLADSAAAGSHDESSGSLFTGHAIHKTLLFQDAGCLRADQSGCAPLGSAFYDVTHNGVDAMLQRLVGDAELMARDDPGAGSAARAADRLAFLWTVAWRDLHDGLARLSAVYLDETRAAFASERTTHIVLLLAMVLGGAAFLLLLVRPFLRAIAKESRRCAELLAQLPHDLDVEGMVAAVWSVVKEERLIAERSGRTFIGALGGASTTLLARLSSVGGGASMNGGGGGRAGVVPPLRGLGSLAAGGGGGGAGAGGYDDEEEGGNAARGGFTGGRASARGPSGAGNSGGGGGGGAGGGGKDWPSIARMSSTVGGGGAMTARSSAAGGGGDKLFTPRGGGGGGSLPGAGGSPRRAGSGRWAPTSAGGGGDDGGGVLHGAGGGGADEALRQRRAAGGSGGGGGSTARSASRRAIVPVDE